MSSAAKNYWFVTLRRFTSRSSPLDAVALAVSLSLSLSLSRFTDNRWQVFRGILKDRQHSIFLQISQKRFLSMSILFVLTSRWISVHMRLSMKSVEHSLEFIDGTHSLRGFAFIHVSHKSLLRGKLWNVILTPACSCPFLTVFATESCTLSLVYHSIGRRYQQQSLIHVIQQNNQREEYETRLSQLNN